MKKRENRRPCSTGVSVGIQGEAQTQQKGLRKRSIHIKCLKLNESFSMYDEDIETFKDVCNGIKNGALESHELEIEKTQRPTYINYNQRALINKTQIHIPRDIEIALSFGWKFIFSFAQNNGEFTKTFALIEDCIENTLNPIRYHEAFTRTAMILKESNSIVHDNNVIWLNFICQRTGRFLKNNPNIFATRSDKGPHTVVIGVNQYKDEINGMISDKETYREIKNDNLTLIGLVNKEEKLRNLIKKNFKTKHLVRGNSYTTLNSMDYQKYTEKNSL